MRPLKQSLIVEAQHAPAITWGGANQDPDLPERYAGGSPRMWQLEFCACPSHMHEIGMPRLCGFGVIGQLICVSQLSMARPSSNRRSALKSLRLKRE